MPAHALSTYRFPEDACIALIERGPDATLTPEAPALSAMTDLAHVHAATVHPGRTLPEAERQMIEQKVQMLFVVSRMPCVDGILTLSAMHGDRALQLVHERGVRYGEILVADVMATLPQIDVLELEAVRRATVGDLARAFQDCGSTHLLVVEGGTGAGRIRGVISYARLQRGLGAAVPLLRKADSFAELARALA
jgi:CBS domain-containing protein